MNYQSHVEYRQRCGLEPLSADDFASARYRTRLTLEVLRNFAKNGKRFKMKIAREHSLAYIERVFGMVIFVAKNAEVLVENDDTLLMSERRRLRNRSLAAIEAWTFIFERARAKAARHAATKARRVERRIERRRRAVARM